MLNSIDDRNIVIIEEDRIRFPCFQKTSKLETEWIYQLQKQCSNKNIVSIKKIERLGNELKISMLKYDSNLYEFRSQLDDQIIHRGFNKILALNLLKQILNGYQLFYDNRIAHRDIKPNNIVVVQNNQFDHQFLLADLDSAQQYHSTIQWSSDNTTFLFSAPELNDINKRPQNKDLYLSQDIYSIGLTFYFMLHFQLPYKNRNGKSEFNEKQKGILNLNQKWYNLLFDQMTKTQVEQRISYQVLKQKVDELFLTKQAKNIQLYFSSQQSQNDAYYFFKKLNSLRINSLPKIYCLQQIKQHQNSYVLKITFRHYQQTLLDNIRTIAFIEQNRRIIYALNFQIQILSAYKILYENKLYLEKIKISVKEKFGRYYYLIQNLGSIQFNMHNFRNQQEQNQFFQSEIKKLGVLFKKFSQSLINENQFPKYSNLLNRMINYPNSLNFSNIISETQTLLFEQQKQQQLNKHDSRIMFVRQIEQPNTYRRPVQNFQGDTSVPRSITPQNFNQPKNSFQNQSPITPRNIGQIPQNFIQQNNRSQNQLPLTPRQNQFRIYN